MTRSGTREQRKNGRVSCPVGVLITAAMVSRATIGGLELVLDLKSHPRLIEFSQHPMGWRCILLFYQIGKVRLREAQLVIQGHRGRST